jgi:HlyD family secretion protein
MMQRINRGMLASLAAFGMLPLVGCQPDASDVVPLYDSETVEVMSIQVSVEASGVIEPVTTVEVKSKASGEILSVHADTGDVVEAGSLLVEVDKRTPRNQLAEAEASLKAARARRQIAETAMRRAERLFESGTLTQTDYEQSQLEFANSEAQVVSAEVSLENARIAMSDTEVRATIGGTIIERHIEPGAVISSPTQAVSDGTILMKMADLSIVQVRALVDETDIGKIHPGMDARVIVAAYPNQPFQGEVRKIEPQAFVDQNVTMFAVLIKLDNERGLLRPGMNAEVSIEIAARESVTAVPTAALRSMSDIPMTATMLGVPASQIYVALDPNADPQAMMAASRPSITIGGRTVPLPEGVDPQRVEELMRARESGQELSAEERNLMRTIMGQAFGERPGGAGRPTAGPGRGSWSGPGESPGGYQFGGEYWVVALRNNRPVPVKVVTGLTDLEYSEVVSGLQPGDRVLLLPSTSLFEQQERLQQFISERFSTGPFQQQQPQQGGRGPRF